MTIRSTGEEDSDLVRAHMSYSNVLELQSPHGFLVGQGKQTAIARTEQLDIDNPYLVVSNGEAFGVAELDRPAQIKTKDFDSKEWFDQHRVTPRERRQWWNDAETFYIYRLSKWQPFKSIKLYEDGQVVDEPKLTPAQWEIVSAAKQLPKQITLIDDAVGVTERKTFIFDKSIYPRSIENVLRAAYDLDYVVSDAVSDTYIPIYSLALVRNPRMRVSKKNAKQEGDNMPYRIRSREDEYCVVKINADDSDGETIGCHDTQDGAEAQLAALRINVEKGQSGGNDTPSSGKNIFGTEQSIGQRLNVIADEDGRLDRIDYMIVGDDDIVFAPKEPDLKKPKPPEPKSEGFLTKVKKAIKTLSDIVMLAENENEETNILKSNYGVAQKKVNGELWHFTWSTNAFMDREGEIFSTKSLEKYVSEAEKKADKGYFNLWHINAEDGNFNTDFARKEWQGVMGRFLVEAGPYLDNEKGAAAKEFFSEYADGHPELAPEGWGCSPEFRYLPEEREIGIYENIWITRTSTLPKFAAANVWTDTRQLARSKNMALSEAQMKAAIAAFGKDEIEGLIAEAEKRTAELESAGVAHKDKTEDGSKPEAKDEKPSETQPQQINMEDLATEVSKQFTANLAPMVERIESLSTGLKDLSADFKELKDWKAAQDKERNIKDRTESPRFIFEMKRASEDDGTMVTEDDKLKKQKPEEAKAENSGDSFSRIFSSK